MTFEPKNTLGHFLMGPPVVFAFVAIGAAILLSLPFTLLAYALGTMEGVEDGDD